MASIRYLVCCIVLCYACQNETSDMVSLSLDKVPYAQLSDYNFFNPNQLSNLDPHPGVVPYEVITPLFTDYASKARFVYSAQGPSPMNDDGTIAFNDGTVLIKNFYYPNYDSGDADKDMVETRLLIRSDGEWNAYTYLWDDNDRDATLTNVGAYKDVRWKNDQGEMQNIQYTVPNKNQCKGCHNVDNELLPIGPKYKNLNSDYDYSSGSQNQIDHWIAAGILAPNTQVNTYTMTDWTNTDASVEDRALAYLEMNCGHCHDEQGQAHTTGLYLNTDHENLTQLGICKTPVAAGKGSGGRSVGVLPGDAEGSILYYRMVSDDPGVMMPELGRTIAHDEGVRLIREWINSMEYSCDTEKPN